MTLQDILVVAKEKQYSIVNMEVTFVPSHPKHNIFDVKMDILLCQQT